jgi:putative transposase
VIIAFPDATFGLAERPEPANTLSGKERSMILETCNEKAYASLPPSQIVPRLADKGKYLASESSFYRILKDADQSHERGRAKARQKRPL